MGRKIIDCSEMPSDINCTLTIAGTDDEVMKAAVEHAVSHPWPHRQPATARRHSRNDERSGPGISHSSHR